MIHFEVLRPDPEFHLTIEDESSEPDLECPFSVPLFFAQNCERGDVMVWRDVETNVVGVFAGDKRGAWRQALVDRANIAVLHPGKGNPGVVGLEIGLVGESEERPVLAVDVYSRAILDWFKARKSVFEEYFSVDVQIKDYGAL